MKTFTIGKLFIGYSICKPNTLWYHNDIKPEREINQRSDSLLGLSRIYHRNYIITKYTYNFTIGRLSIFWAWF